MSHITNQGLVTEERKPRVVCRWCGANPAKDPKITLRRCNPKGEIGIWECTPYCIPDRQNILQEPSMSRRAAEEIKRPFIDPEEKRVHCADCNGYLWSMHVSEPGNVLIPCPYKEPGPYRGSFKCRMQSDRGAAHQQREGEVMTAMSEHQALGEALAMLRDLMIAVVIHEDLELATNIMNARTGEPAKWNRCWKDAEEAMKEPTA